MDKRVPVGIILALMIQTAIVSSYLGSLESRVSTIEGSRFTAAQGARLEAMAQNNREDIKDLEQRTLKSLDDIKALLVRIEDRLDRTEREAGAKR